MGEITDKVKKLIVPTATPAQQIGTLNDMNIAGPYSARRIEAAQLETQHPILDPIKATRELIAGALWHMPKAGAKKLAGYASDVTTGLAALPPNAARWTLSLVGLVPRLTLTALDVATEQTVGRLSRIPKTINAKVHSVLGTQPASERLANQGIFGGEKGGQAA